MMCDNCHRAEADRLVTHEDGSGFLWCTPCYGYAMGWTPPAVCFECRAEFWTVEEWKSHECNEKGPPKRA